MPTLEFKRKPFVYSHHLSVPFRELIVDPKKSYPGGKKASLDDKHLDNEDTEFKRRLFEVLEAAYADGMEAGDVELFSDRPDAMRFRILLQDDNWKSKLQAAIAA